MKSTDRTTERKEKSKMSKAMPAIVTCIAAVIIFAAITVITLSHSGSRNTHGVSDSDYALEIGRDSRPIITPDGEKSESAPTPAPTPVPTAAPSETPTEQVTPTTASTAAGTAKPTPAPTNTPAPTGTVSPTPEATPAEPAHDYSLGNLTFTPEAYAAYRDASAKSRLQLNFYAQNPESREQIAGYRHDGMTFSEWKERIADEKSRADGIFDKVKQSDKKTEYNVDTSQFSWTQRSDIMSKYGDYYAYLPYEWFESMDYYIENSQSYEEELGKSYREIAEEDAAFLNSMGAKASVRSDGRNSYYVMCSVTKLKLESIAQAAQYRYKVTL